MPVSGLVITFEGPVERYATTLRELERIPAVELGKPSGAKLPIVVDSGDEDQDKQIWELLRQMDGVADIAIAMIAFDDGAGRN